MAAWALKDGTE